MNAQVLQKIGLEEKEASLYLELLRLGNTTASKLASALNIDRATTYRYLDSLISKGFCSYAIKNNVKQYQPTNPEKILSDLKEKEQEYEELIPELKALAKQPVEETIAEIYKGKEGIKTILKEIIRKKQDHLVLGDEGHFLKIMPEYFKQFLAQCEKSRIKEKILCNKKAKKKMQSYDYKHSETKALPHEYALPTTTAIFGDSVLIFNWNEPYTVVRITSKTMAESYKVYFELLWRMAEK